MEIRQKLYESIIKMLVLSYYEDECKGSRGTTAEEIRNFEKQAFAKFQGVWTGAKSYESIVNRIETKIFHARISRDVSYIMSLVERYMKAKSIAEVEQYELEQEQIKQLTLVLLDTATVPSSPSLPEQEESN